jgi:hypothetical protein
MVVWDYCFWVGIRTPGVLGLFLLWHGMDDGRMGHDITWAFVGSFL